MRVGIIGGGVSGLALAHELGKAGVDVEIFERGPELGGLAAGFEVLPDIRLERFYHHIFQTDVDFVDLADELGIADRIMWKPANVGFFLENRIHRFDSPLDVLRFKPLSLWSRVALGRTMLELKLRSSPRAFGDHTVEQWFRRRAASTVYRTVWAPMLEAKWGTDRDNLAATWLWQKVRARGNSRRGLKEELGYPVGGFSQLPDALSRRISDNGGKVHLRTVVQRIRTEDGRVVGVETDNGSTDVDAVVSTLPLVNLLPLVPALPAEARDRIAGIGYRGVVCHVLVMDRPLSDIYWLNIADRGIPLGGVVEQTNFVPPDNYRGKHIAYLFSYLDQQDPELTMPEGAFVDHHFPHLRRIFPGFTPDQVENRFVFRTRVASPIYRHPYEPPPIQPMPGLWLADTSRIFPMDRGTNECVRLARYLSDRILGRRATPPRPV